MDSGQVEGEPSLLRRDPFASIVVHGGEITLVVAEAVQLDVKVYGVDSQPGFITVADLARQDSWVTGSIMELRQVGSNWQWDGNSLAEPIKFKVPGSLVQCLNPKLLTLRDAERPNSSADGPPAEHIGYLLVGSDMSMIFEQLVQAQKTSKESLFKFIGSSSSTLPYKGHDGQPAFMSPAGPVDDFSAAASGRSMLASKKVKCTVRGCGRTVKVCTRTPHFSSPDC